MKFLWRNPWADSKGLGR